MREEKERVAWRKRRGHLGNEGAMWRRKGLYGNEGASGRGLGCNGRAQEGNEGTRDGRNGPGRE